MGGARRVAVVAALAVSVTSVTAATAGWDHLLWRVQATTGTRVRLEDPSGRRVTFTGRDSSVGIPRARLEMHVDPDDETDEADSMFVTEARVMIAAPAPGRWSVSAHQPADIVTPSYVYITVWATRDREADATAEGEDRSVLVAPGDSAVWFLHLAAADADSPRVEVIGPTLAGPPFSADAFIDAARRTPVNRLDARLPAISLDRWLRSLAASGTSIAWDANDCGEFAGTPADVSPEFPVCAAASLATRDGSRLGLTIAVGSLDALVAPASADAVYDITLKRAASRRSITFAELVNLADSLRIERAVPPKQR